MLNNYEVIKRFLEEIGLNPEHVIVLNEFKNEGLMSERKYAEVLKLIKDILVDMYNLTAPDVSDASDYYMGLGIAFGREHKNILKEYFDYHDENKAKQLLNLLSFTSKSKLIFDDDKVLKYPLNKFHINRHEEAVDLFRSAMNSTEDLGKIKDYLLSIYTKLLLNENSNKTLKNMFEENQKFYDGQLSTKSIRELRDYCESITEVLPIEELAKIFQTKYIELLDNDFMNQNDKVKFGKNLIREYDYESVEHILFHVNQNYFELFKSKRDFYINICETIENSYKVLKNYHAFTIKIDNVYLKDENLKWEIHSIIGIFTDRMIRYREELNYYHPEEIVSDFLGSGVDDSKMIIQELKPYYKNKSDSFDIDKYLNGETHGLKGIIDDFKDIEIGFNFTDCFILKKKEAFRNPGLPIIDNHTELLYVFYKYRLDQRLVPCPSCGSLHIGGNSFPDVWHRSFECQNIYCPDRSKSNRGKRYSVKTSYMQFGSLSKEPDDLITKDLINTWRKDIVDVSDDKEILNMISKFFTFKNETLLVINGNTETNEINNRKVVFENIREIEYDTKGYLNSGYYRIFQDPNGRLRKYVLEFDENNKEVIIKPKKEITLINGDSKEVLYLIEEGSISAAVTSPPYYNAREYSNWKNLYLYLKDMFKIAKSVLYTLKPGGIYLYNIGDILGNDNMIVKSNMGTKKMQLGAYTYYIFKEAGFEFLDNIIWDKGEVQSNRQMNDGKNTPHYQKPMNAYEHMYLFKKSGSSKTMNASNWKSNVEKFNPVIKINSKGENILGHTAPFPDDIPDFVIKAFTNENDIVLDPFSGSLTTAIQASKNNRIGLGVEYSVS